MNRTTLYSIISALVLLLILIGAYFLFFHTTASVSTNGTNSSGFNTTIPSTDNTTPAPTDTNGAQTINTTTTSQQKIFEITAGPVVGATLMQTLRPTTTIARYIRQDDGHVYDIPLGVSGAVPKVVSNITIPGGERAIWLEGGNAAIMQYLDDSMVVKTVYMGFPISTTTNTAARPTKINFLPDNLVDIAASPDGKSVVYLVKTSYGADGYIAKSDGTASRKLFSLPLSQMELSWPSQNIIVAESNAAAGIEGVAFSVNTQTGATTQLVSGSGISVTANPAFSILLYQIADGNNLRSYLHSVQKSIDIQLPISPLPEQCIWSRQNAMLAFCAATSQVVSGNYVDQRHMGLASAANTIFRVFMTTATVNTVAAPGSNNGGVASDILEMALSPDEHYLSYTTKGDRSLWGVLLQQ